MLQHAIQPTASNFGALDIFAAGSGFDIAGAWLLASGIMVKPEKAAGRLVQGQNSFARFDVRSAEDYADGQIGRAILAFGFVLQAVGYVLSAHGQAPLAHSSIAYLALIGFALVAIVLVATLAHAVRPWLRKRWLVEYAKFDNMGWRHELPNGSELFDFGRILNIQPLSQREVADRDAYARRVFGTRTRDPSKDHEARPPNFQPFAPLDDEHGYFSKQPKNRWKLRRSAGSTAGDEESKGA